jgi:hypothetical protein
MTPHGPHRENADESTSLGHRCRQAGRVRLRVEAVDFARIQPVRGCDLARRVRLRVEGLGGAHAQPDSGERDAA